jgi:hypothetical protein
MKQSIIFLTLSLILLLSCKNDENKTTQNNKKRQLYGSWQLTVCITNCTKIKKVLNLPHLSIINQ